MTHLVAALVAYAIEPLKLSAIKLLSTWDTYQILKRYLNEHPYRLLPNDHRLIRLNELS